MFTNISLTSEYTYCTCLRRWNFPFSLAHICSSVKTNTINADTVLSTILGMNNFLNWCPSYAIFRLSYLWKTTLFITGMLPKHLYVINNVNLLGWIYKNSIYKNSLLFRIKYWMDECRLTRCYFTNVM